MKEEIAVTKKDNKREAAPDLMRVTATCAVVLLHTITGVSDHTDMSLFPVQNTVFLILMDLITWCVPVFVMVSGYFFLDPTREIPGGKMIGKYCRRILLALFIFGTPYALLELLVTEKQFRVGMLWESIWMVCTGNTWSHMWYLYMIFLLYLFTPVIRFGLSKISVKTIWILEAFLFVGSSILPFCRMAFSENLWALSDWWIYVFYYLAGYLLAAHKRNNSLESNLPKGKGKTGFACGVIILLAAGMTLSRLVGTYSVRMAYNYPFTVILAVALMIAVFENEKIISEKAGEWLKKTDELSFGIYLVHPVFLNLFYKFLNKTPLDYFKGASLPIFFGIALLGSAVIVFVLRKISLLRKYVL